MIRLFAGFFFVGFSAVFFIYLLFMSPSIYRDVKKFFRIIKEDLRIFFYRADKENLYAMTETADNTIWKKKLELKEWYHMEFKKDPKPFILFFILAIIGIVGIILVIFI